MKKEHVIGLCLMVVFIGAAIILVTNPPGLPGSMGTSQKNITDARTPSQSPDMSGEIPGVGHLSHNLVLNGSGMKAPGNVMVYKTLPTVVTKADAIAFAKKFNFTDIDEPKEGYAAVSVCSKDRRYYATLYKNGGQYYEDYARSDTPNGIDLLENLPSDEEARKIATAFLKDRDLLPQDAVFDSVEHRKAYLLNNSGGEPTVDWEDIIVYYNRTLNGLDVEGTQFEIEVGGHGDIIRFFSNWKEYQAIGEFPVKSAESAFQELDQKRMVTLTGSDKPDTVSVDEMHLAYYTNAVAYHEDYLEPVWVFKGQAMANGKVISPVEDYISALPATSPVFSMLNSTAPSGASGASG